MDVRAFLPWNLSDLRQHGPWSIISIGSVVYIREATIVAKDICVSTSAIGFVYHSYVSLYDLCAVEVCVSSKDA